MVELAGMAFQVFFDLAVQVEPELIIELLFDFIAAEECTTMPLLWQELWMI